MSRLRLAGLSVDIDAPGPHGLTDFLDRINETHPVHGDALRFRLRRGGSASLVVDDRHRLITLTLPAAASGALAQIGFLQALTRGIAFVERSANNLVLLHGSALAIPGGGAVAVLDGGLGQGKTSLALGLARRYGRLLVDEFAFARTRPGGVVLSAAATLPWHVRADMAPHLVPASTSGPLWYPDELRPVAQTASRQAVLRLILVPDRGAPVGHTMPVRPEQAPGLLRHAVTDHLAKLADPCLDHVSVFTSAGQVTDPAGQPLTAPDSRPAGRETVPLRMLTTIPTYRIGIGPPGELPGSVSAAGRLIEAMPT